MLVCGKCQRSLPETEFHRNRRTASGRASRCKDCVREYHREYVTREYVRLEKRYRNFVDRFGGEEAVSRAALCDAEVLVTENGIEVFPSDFCRKHNCPCLRSEYRHGAQA